MFVGHLLALDGIPEVWSVKDLAKIFEKLMVTYKTMVHGTFEDWVKAIIDAALSQSPTIINESFNAKYDSKLKFGDFKRNTSRGEFVHHVAKNASSSQTSVTRFYFSVASGNSYPEEISSLSDKDRSKFMMTWLTSYIIICAFGKKNCKFHL